MKNATSAVLPDVLRYTPMQSSDLDAVAQAEAELYDFPWSRANFADSLAAGYSAWVCRSDGALVGYSVMMLALDEAHLLNISIAKPWQRRGHGQALLGFIQDVARANGASTLFLEVRPSNAAAIALYRRNRYHEIGKRRGYYPALFGREDALVMSVVL